MKFESDWPEWTNSMLQLTLNESISLYLNYFQSRIYLDHFQNTHSRRKTNISKHKMELCMMLEILHVYLCNTSCLDFDSYHAIWITILCLTKTTNLFLQWIRLAIDIFRLLLLQIVKLRIWRRRRFNFSWLLLVLMNLVYNFSVSPQFLSQASAQIASAMYTAVYSSRQTWRTAQG